MANNDEMVRYMLKHLHGSHLGPVPRGLFSLDPSYDEPDEEQEECENSPAKKRGKPEEVQGVTWEDIGGQEEAKRLMIEAIELPFTHKDVFAFYGIKPPKGILLYGPPGCGKTMFGKAAATAIAKIHGGKGDGDSFVYVKAPVFRQKHVGEGEGMIRDLFAKARKHRQNHGFPAVIFVDEADAVLESRADSDRQHEHSIVASFLTEMDGMEDSGAIIILATNRPESIDPAIVRDGRIDRKIKVGRPDLAASRSILRMNLNPIPVKGVTHDALARLMAREFFSPDRIVFRLHTDIGVHHLTLAHLINGAMLAGAVNQAASLALHRDLAAKTQTGLRRKDVIRAIDGIQRQQLDLDHSDAARDLIEQVGGKLLRVEKVTAVQRLAEPDTAPGPKNIFEEAA